MIRESLDTKMDGAQDRLGISSRT